MTTKKKTEETAVEENKPMEKKLDEDNTLIDITLGIPEWDNVLEWFARSPKVVAGSILKRVNDTIEQIKADKTQEERKELRTVTISLTITEINNLLLILELAPYYRIAEVISSIHSQGTAAIKQLLKDNKTPEVPAS